MKGFGQIDIDATAPAEPKPAEDDDNLTVVRTKRVSLKPTDSQEAILQMDMLGQDFIFIDAAPMAQALFISGVTGVMA